MRGDAVATTGPNSPPKRKGEQRLGPFHLVDEFQSAGPVQTWRARYRPESDSPALPLSAGAYACVRALREEKIHDVAASTRFSREAELLGLVDHPNVVRHITRGLSEQRVWTALEYVEGETIAGLFSLMRQEGLRLRPELVVSIGADLLAGLAAAQAVIDPRGRALGLVHRNLTPKNVMVDHTGATKLIDLGSALLSVREEPSTRNVVGTLGWLAPEQARRDQLTQAVDVYQVALLMFELLTGTRAFPVENTPNDVALRMHRDNKHAPWPARLDVPIELKALIEQALSTDPELRPNDAAAFHALADGLQSDPEEARRRLAVVMRDVLRGANDRPAPVYV